MNKIEQTFLIFLQWSKELGIHGYPSIFRTNNKLLKLVWTLSFITAILACSYLNIQSLIQYFEYQVNSRIQTVYETSMAMPGFSICTSGTLRSPQGQRFVNEFYKSKYNTTNADEVYKLFGPTEPITSLLLQLNSILTTSSSLDLKYDQLFMSCTLGVKSCQEYGVIEFGTVSTGNCFKLNAGFKSTDNILIDPNSIYSSSKTTTNSGLTAEIYLGHYNNSINLNNDTFVGITLFNQSDMLAKVKNYDIKISPGFCTVVKLSKEIRKSLPQPYSSCQDADQINTEISKKMKAKGILYRQTICSELCLQEMIIKECHCFSQMYINIEDTVKTCGTSQSLECVNRVYASSLNSLVRLCEAKCKNETYLVVFLSHKTCLRPKRV